MGDAARRQQRYLERGVRFWREREAAALTDEARRAAQVHIRSWDERLGEHAARYGLVRKVHREFPGAGYAPTSAARAADPARL